MINMRKLSYLPVIASFLALTPAVFAQTVVGSPLVGGQKIEILSNNTWRFTDLSETNCQSLGQGLCFCGAKEIWKPTTPPSGAIAAQYHYDDRHYGRFIVEGLGLDDGMNKKLMRDAVITNAAAATGVSPTDIPVDTMIDGNPSETVIYAVSFDGLDVAFANMITILPKSAFQSIVFAIGTDYSNRHKELKAELVSLIKIEDN